MHGFPFGPFSSDNLTPEQEAELQRRRELFEMAHEDGVASVNDLLENLSTEHLKTLRAMLTATMGDENDRFALHQIGWINALLWLKFKICNACGKVHEEMPLILKEDKDD